MSKLINIRGTNGSGKSHCVHHLLEKYDSDELVEHGELLGYYIEALDLHVVGPYETDCGGCDQVSEQFMVEDRVEEFACGHVLYEGLIVSHTYGRWADFIKRLPEHEHHLLFLDTPEAKCIEHVQKRRDERGDTKPFNPINLQKDWTQARRTFKKFEALFANRDTCSLRWVNAEQAIASVEKLCLQQSNG